MCPPVCQAFGNCEMGFASPMTLIGSALCCESRDATPQHIFEHMVSTRLLALESEKTAGPKTSRTLGSDVFPIVKNGEMPMALAIFVDVDTGSRKRFVNSSSSAVLQL